MVCAFFTVIEHVNRLEMECNFDSFSRLNKMHTSAHSKLKLDVPVVVGVPRIRHMPL
jgi:hypothetical protein